MLPTRVRIQLAVFAIISLVVLTIASVYYVGLPRLVGVGQYTVKARFDDTSGLYPRAIVTYRGVDVGIVQSLDLGPKDVTVTLSLDNGTSIPANATASIQSTSAVGEQYVELTPTSGDGPKLHDGSVIAKTVELPQVTNLLDGLNRLLVAVPKTQLTQVLDNVTTALGGAGSDVSSLVRDSQSLLASARANLKPTLGLINSAGTVLDQQRQLAGQTRQTVGYLNSFTTVLAQVDPNIRKLIDQGPGLASAFTKLIDGLRPTLPTLLSNVNSVGTILDPYVPALEDLLVVLPATLSATESVFVGPDTIPRTAEVDFKLNIGDPPPCGGSSSGYVATTQQRSADDLSPASSPRNPYCKTTPSDSAHGGRSIRGARNLPCLSPNAVVARAATVEQCLGIPLAPLASQSGDAATTTTTATPAAVTFGGNVNAPRTLRQLLSAPAR